MVVSVGMGMDEMEAASGRGLRLRMVVEGGGGGSDEMRSGRSAGGGSFTLVCVLVTTQSLGSAELA